VMPPGSLLLRPGEVVVEIGQPIDVSAVKSADRDALIERVRGEIQRRTGQASRPDRSSNASTSPEAASARPPGP
jgi:hypothetical protein